MAHNEYLQRLPASPGSVQLSARLEILGKSLARGAFDLGKAEI